MRAIQATDLATGRSVVLGIVRDSVPAEMLPPNRIVYSDAFDSEVLADIVLVWRHNFFAQETVLRSRPVLPPELNPETSRFEIVTEFIDVPDPELTKLVSREPGGADLPDHALIRFGRLNIIKGHAFLVDERNGVTMGASVAAMKGVPVAKQWQELEDGRKFLIESLSWTVLMQELDKLGIARAESTQSSRNRQSIVRSVTTQRDWPKSVASTLELKPIRLAAAAYEPKGYVMDFVVVPDAENPTIFATGNTYLIRTSTYNGTSATFQPGCVIKYYGANAAFLALYGSIYFPETLQSPVFTSLDNDSYGERIIAPAQDPPFPSSDGDPTGDLQQDCLNIWYVNYSTDVKNAIFRWGITGIEYSWTGSSANHTIRNCRFEKIGAYAVTANIDPNRSVTFVNSEKYQVPADKYVSQGSVSGTLAAALFGVEKGFIGITGIFDDNPDAPVQDTMGAIGAGEFMEVLNKKIAYFSRSSGSRTPTTEMHLDNFFKISGETRTMFDPRVWYDHANQRWIICAEDSVNDALVVKVSTSSSASLAETNWKRYVVSIPVGANDDADFPTLGSDANGYYISIQVKQSTTHKGFYIQALKKPDVFDPTYTLPALLFVGSSDKFDLRVVKS